MRYPIIFLLLFFFLKGIVLPCITYGKESGGIHLPAQDLAQKKYQEIITSFNAKKYSKTATHIENFLALFHEDLKRYPKIKFFEAYCSYYNKDYLVSAQQFKIFYKKNVALPEVEEAVYMRACALSCMVPAIELDQKPTECAIKKLKKYLTLFPTGNYATKVAEKLTNLEDQLVQKSFQSAVFYYNIAQYRASLISLENFQQEFPHTGLCQQALYIQAKSQYKYANSSTVKDKKNALQKALNYCQYFLKKYPDSQKIKDIQHIIDEIKKQ